ncbi:hypothetical protein LSH36_420g00028 [Paralvinella palmiformis]|uniref:CIP2A N-terminal domain-containing protein n=1 Tax=Paralvinella palmiformis TaxID=53620 RepID=A0AAD9JC79_9ANNE|nr:hypothetical protein LSH36_420g00028 [Paralvinella palmiformis]
MKSEGGSTLRYTVDVFTDLIKHSRIKKLLSIYSDLDHCLSQLLLLLQKRQGDEVVKVIN